MTSYVPGQLSALFLSADSKASNEPAAPEGAKKKQKKQQKKQQASVETSNATEALCELFKQSVRAEPSSATTTKPAKARAGQKADAQEETNNATASAVRSNDSVPAAVGQQKKKRKVRADDQLEEKFEQLVQARSLATQEDNPPLRHIALDQSSDDKHPEKLAGSPAEDSTDDDDDDDDNDNDAEDGDQKLVRPRKGNKVQNASRDDDPARLARTLFIGNLPVAVLDKSQYREFKTHFKKHGSIESVRFRSIAFSRPLNRRTAFVSKQLHNERDTLNAYIVFKKEESVAAALADNGTELFGNHIRIDRAVSANQFDRKRCVFVGNLQFDIQEEMLWKHFGECGKVVNVRVVRDRKSNVGKGFAYVSFEDKAAVGLALRLHESRLGKRTIRVQRCVDTRHGPKEAAGGQQHFEGVRAVRGATGNASAAKRRKTHSANKSRTNRPGKAR